MNTKNGRLFFLFSHFPQVAATAAIALGFLVLLGWALDLAVFRSIAPEWAPMKPNGALAFILAGVSLWGAYIETPSRRARRLARAGAVLVGMVGLLTLAEYLSARDLGIDGLFYWQPASQAGRMSPTTAFNFIILGVALFFLNREKSSRVLGMVHFFAALAGLVALLALVGYLYDIASLYQLNGRKASMALPTALGFLLLSIGIVSASPDFGLMRAAKSQGVAGVTARRLLPAAFGFPLISGWLVLEGCEAGWFDDGFGFALFAVTTMIVFTALIRWNTCMLYRSEGQRQQAEQELIRHQAELEELVEKRTGELAAVYRGLDAAREEQKAGIARELHDELGGILASLKMSCSRIDDYLRDAKADAEMAALSGKSLELIESAIDFKRRIVNDLRPAVLDDLGIASAIQWQAGEFSKRTGIPCEVVLYDDEAQFGRETSLVLFRILQEALTNIGKHAQATRVQITLSREEDTVTLEIGDNGVGTLPTSRDRDYVGSHGLRGMQERAQRLGGRVSIIGFPGKGTWVEAILPVESALPATGTA